MSALNLTRPTARYPRLRRACLIVFFAYCALLCYLSLVSVVPGSLDVSDKVMHFVAYGGLTGLMGLAFPKTSLWQIFLISSVIGISLELAQAVAGTGRMASTADQIANMGGAALAVIGWLVLVFMFSKLKPNLSGPN